MGAGGRAYSTRPPIRQSTEKYIGAMRAWAGIGGFRPAERQLQGNSRFPSRSPDANEPPAKECVMPGAGTDKTKRWIEQPAPVVVLVEPQLGENIGAVARAMANFGLSRLRLVKPLQGWPNEKARVMAAGADRVLDNAVLYDSLADGDRRLQLRARRHRAQSRPGQAGDRGGRGGGRGGAARGRRRDGGDRVRARAQRAGEPRGRRSPTASSRCRSIRPSPRSIWRRRW